MARTNRPTTLDPDAWKKKAQEIQARIAKKDAERKAQRDAEEERNKTLDNIWERAGVKRQDFVNEASDYVGRGGTYTAPLSKGVEKWLNTYNKKRQSPLERASAHNLIRNLFKENPSEALAMYEWLDKNAKGWNDNPDYKSIHDDRRSIMMNAERGKLPAEDALGYESLEAQAVSNPLLAKELQMAKETGKKTDELYLSQKKRDDEAMEAFKKKEAAEVVANLKDLKPEISPSTKKDHKEFAETLAKGITDEYHKTRRKDLLDKALKYGFNGKEHESKLTAAYDKAFAKHGDVEKAYNEVENSLNKNANKKFMAQRGAQMNADLKAREDAIRNNPRAAEKRAALKAQWGNPTMSQAQMEAKARWDAKRDITSGTRGNLSAFPQQKAYRASPQYGQDVYGMAQQNGRTLTPGSVGSTYEQNYNFNKGLTQAQLDSAKGLANVVDQVPVGGKPTTPQVNGVANTPVTTGADPNKNPLGV